MAKKAKKDKKASTKAVIAGKAAKKLRYWEGNVPGEFAFFMCDGKVVKNLRQLVKTFDEINDDVFNYHANMEKNDFSSWIKDVMDYHDLAGNMLGKNRHAAKETILLYMKTNAGKKV